MKETNEAKEIFSRFKQGAGVTSIADLARALGVAQQSVYNVQANGKIPGSWFRKIADLNNISIDWLTYGEGAMYRDSVQPDPAMPDLALPDSALLQSQHERPQTSPCAQCTELKKELTEERTGWREVVTENRQLWVESRKLWKEIAELRAHTARLEEQNIRLPKGGAIDAPNSAPNAHFNTQCNK